MIPYSIPPISLGSLLLLFFTISKVGAFIERIFSVLFNFKALLIVHFILSFSVMVFFTKNAFMSISKEFEDFARVLGYGRIRSLLIILIPMVRNQLLYTYIMGFMRAFKDFGAFAMVAGAIIGKTELRYRHTST
uniref:ABC transporter permease subunit n=1 Tax=Ignisphaera aggregans TaxID=334771 RepID=A0A7J3QFI8_9CREN